MLLPRERLLLVSWVSWLLSKHPFLSVRVDGVRRQPRFN